jgi:hypothetical protein
MTRDAIGINMDVSKSNLEEVKYGINEDGLGKGNWN